MNNQAHAILVSDPLAKGVNPDSIVDGVIVKGNNNHGYITLTTSEIVEVSPGYYDNKTRVTQIRGRIEPLREIVAKAKLTPGCNLSSTWRPSRLIVKEQLTPFYGPTESNPTRKPQQPKIKPIEGEDDGYVLLKDGQPIYRQTFLVQNQSPEIDILIKHDAEGVRLSEFTLESVAVTSDEPTA